MKAIGDKLNLALTVNVLKDGTGTALSLADILGKPTVVSIYMRNNTSSCDKQNASLAAAAAAIAAKGWQVLAVSRDTCASHAKYAGKMGICYWLASDPDDLLAQEFEAIVEKSMYGKKYMGPARAAFFVQTDGTIVDIIEKVDSKRHGEEVLERIQQL